MADFVYIYGPLDILSNGPTLLTLDTAYIEGPIVALSAGEFELVVDTGEYSLTGNDANLLKHSVLSAETGTYNLTGNDANLLVDLGIRVTQNAVEILGEYIPIPPAPAPFIEYFADDATSTLASPMSVLDTIVDINIPTSPFPLQFPFRVRVGDEYMLVTSAVGLTWTVTRGEEGSTIATHAIGDEVANVFTLESLTNMAWVYSQVGTRAALPTPEIDLEGRFYFQDDPGVYIKRDGGDVWNSFGPFYELYEPENGLYSWINQQTASVSTTNGGIVLSSPAPSGAGENINLRVKTIAVSPYVAIAGFIPLLYPEDQTSTGLAFRESSTGRIIFFRLMFDTTTTTKTDLVISLDKYTSPTIFSANYKVTTANILKSSLIWFAVEDDGADLIFSYSNNNIDYTVFYQVARDDFFTVGPDQIGHAINSNTTSGNAVLTLLSWKEI